MWAHPFYTQDSEWVDAEDLTIGQRVLNADGEYGTVELYVPTEMVAPMYNLTVSEVHTYFVGAGQWAVHNTSCAIDWSVREPDEFNRLATENGMRSPGSELEAQGILQARYEGYLTNPERPEVTSRQSRGPDFTANILPSNEHRFVDIKTPRNFQSMEAEALVIETNIRPISADVAIVVDLRELTDAEATDFLNFFNKSPNHDVFIVSKP